MCTRKREPSIGNGGCPFFFLKRKGEGGRIGRVWGVLLVLGEC